MIKVIIAEDHRAIIDGIDLRLQKEDDIIIVGKASNGKQLVDLVRHKKADVVITDIGMPEQNGISATRIIKNEFPDVKVIAFSMFDQQQALEDMIDAGASGYLLKSSSLDELSQAIKTVYEGRRYFDEKLEKQPKNYIQKNALTKRQKQILELVGEGKSSRDIAEQLNIGLETVHTHRKNMMRILNLSGKAELIRYAMEEKYRYKEDYKN